MKRLFVFVALMVAIVSTLSAQSPLLATLSHDGEISTFFGENAFDDAYKAATDGDIITLGVGRFVRPSAGISKTITIRGCGMDRTYIQGGVLYYGVRNADISIVFEGLRFVSDLKSTTSSTGQLQLIKCKANYVHLDKNWKNYVVQSIITNLRYGCGTFMGCYIKGSYDSSETTGLFNSQVENCTLSLDSKYYLQNSTFKNCVMQSVGEIRFTSPVIMTSSIYIGDESHRNSIIDDSDFPCKYLPSGTEFLKDGTITYELRDDLTTQWIGTDGTQVGMYGGPIPFDPRLSTPIIKKFNVSSKTSADGKLSVDIEVDNID